MAVLTLDIDSQVTFKLANGRALTVEARDLAEYRRTLFLTKGAPKPEEPEGPKYLMPDVYLPAIKTWIKERYQIDLSDGEAEGIFDNAERAWGAVQKNWQPPTEGTPTSPVSTAPQFSD